MKYLLLILSMLFVSAGCGPETAQNSDVVKLSVNGVLAFPAEGGEQIFSASAAKPLVLQPESDWIAVETVKKTGDVSTVKVIADRNDSPSERSTRISVSAGGEPKYVEISQAAASPSVGGEVILPEGSLASVLPEFMGMGWNLGNQFDAYNNVIAGETAWGNPAATQETFNKVRAAGFKSVRIPVTWLGKVGGAPNYKVSEAWLNRIAEVVGYAENAGLVAIINIHHDGADSKYWLDIINAAKDDAVHQRILDQVGAMWTQIAEKFKDKGEFLIFEGFNEIHDGKWGWGTNRTDGGKQYKCLNEWNQAFVNAVRATGGNNAERILGVPAYCTNTDLAIEAFVMPEDTAEDRLMISVHCYDPSEYTLTARYSEWGHTAASSKKAPGNNESDLKKVFEKLHNSFISKNIPVYMGEFGCVNRASLRDQSFQQYYLKYYAKLSKTYGVPCILWDNGAKGAGNERHAFIDHATGEYCSPEAKAAVEALLGSYNSSLTLDEVYNAAPKN